jgi:hypothetical protein
MVAGNWSSRAAYPSQHLAAVDQLIEPPPHLAFGLLVIWFPVANLVVAASKSV